MGGFADEFVELDEFCGIAAVEGWTCGCCCGGGGEGSIGFGWTGLGDGILSAIEISR